MEKGEKKRDTNVYVDWVLTSPVLESILLHLGKLRVYSMRDAGIGFNIPKKNRKDKTIEKEEGGEWGIP